MSNRGDWEKSAKWGEVCLRTGSIARPLGDGSHTCLGRPGEFPHVLLFSLRNTSWLINLNEALSFNLISSAILVSSQSAQTWVRESGLLPQASLGPQKKN